MSFRVIARTVTTVKKCRCWPHSACHWRESGACDHDTHTENILKILGSTNVRPEFTEGSEGNALHDVLSWTNSNGESERERVIHEPRQQRNSH